MNSLTELENQIAARDYELAVARKLLHEANNRASSLMGEVARFKRENGECYQFMAEQGIDPRPPARILKALKVLHGKVDALLQHCPDPECSACAAIVCPHGEPLHFHHDGCPACAEHTEHCPIHESERCKCGDEASAEEHPCPYAADINNDSETLCRCCEECQYQCAQDI